MNVKVTVRTFIIKLWLFLLYLLNSWSVSNQIWFYSAAWKPECPVEKWNYCVQGQGHSKGSKCQWMFVEMMFSESQNISLPYFAMLKQHREPESRAEIISIFIFATFIMSRSQRGLVWSKYDSFYYILCELLIPWQLNWVWWYIIRSQSVLWKQWITAFRVKVTANCQNVNVCPNGVFYTTKHFVSNFGIVMHHYESECHAKRFICYFQGQGHCKSSYNQNMTISIVSFELLILLLPNLVW